MSASVMEKVFSRWPSQIQPTSLSQAGEDDVAFPQWMSAGSRNARGGGLLPGLTSIAIVLGPAILAFASGALWAAWGGATAVIALAASGSAVWLASSQVTKLRLSLDASDE